MAWGGDLWFAERRVVEMRNGGFVGEAALAGSKTGLGESGVGEAAVACDGNGWSTTMRDKRGDFGG